MDPQISWIEMLAAIGERDWDSVTERADSLLVWMRTSGFPPQTTATKMSRRWDRAMAEFGCLLALSFSREAQRKKKENQGD